MDLVLLSLINIIRYCLFQDAVSKKWSFPKGRAEIEDINIPLNTAIRETKEEVGLNYMSDYIFNDFEPIMVHYDTYFFKATLLDGANTPCTDGENECAARWFSRHDINNKLWKNTNVYIKQFITTVW